MILRASKIKAERIIIKVGKVNRRHKRHCFLESTITGAYTASIFTENFLHSVLLILRLRECLVLFQPAYFFILFYFFYPLAFSQRGTHFYHSTLTLSGCWEFDKTTTNHSIITGLYIHKFLLLFCLIFVLKAYSETHL